MSWVLVIVVLGLFGTEAHEGAVPDYASCMFAAEAVTEELPGAEASCVKVYDL